MINRKHKKINFNSKGYSDVFRDFLGKASSAGGLGTEEPGISKGYNRNFQRILSWIRCCNNNTKDMEKYIYLAE